MTTVDYLTLSGAFAGLGMTALGLYLTIISGFLVAAFFVGKQLTTSQVLLIVALFIVSACFTIAGTGAGFHWSAVFFDGQTAYKSASFDIVHPAQYIIILQIAGVIGALHFLRHIRTV